MQNIFNSTKAKTLITCFTGNVRITFNYCINNFYCISNIYIEKSSLNHELSVFKILLSIAAIFLVDWPLQILKEISRNYSDT